jgi:hypothetical protein
MAQDLAGVINQLRSNNEEERTRDSSTNKNIAESRRQNTEALASLAKNLSEQFVTVVRTTDQEKQQREAEQEKNATRVAAGEKAWRTRQENAQKKKDGLASANEENQNRMMRVFTNLGAGIKGLNTKFGSFAKSFSDSIKSKVKGGLGAMMDVFKKFAMVGALAALLAFLNSEMFKTLKEKYIDPLTESFGKLFTALGNFKDGIDKIKNNFYDEEGNFDLFGGISKSLQDIKDLLKDTGLALAVVGTLLFRKKLLSMAGSAAGGLMRLFTNGTMFNDEMTKTNNKMSNKLKNSKSRGIFRRGLGGLTGRFGRLFRFFGTKRGLGALIIGAGAAMATQIDFHKTKGWLSDTAAGVGAKFKGMFNAVGDLGKSVLKNAGEMGGKVTTAIGSGILSAKGALMSGFDNMFGALKNLGSGIKDLAGKAAGKVKSVLSATGDDIDGKKKTPKRPEEIEAEKRKAAQNDTELKKKQADNLERMRQEKIAADEEAKKKKKADADYKKKMDAFKDADLKSRKAIIPKIALDSKKLGKEVVKATARFSTKMVPLLGAGFGIFEAGRRLLQGDLVGAGLEAGGILAPSATGIPIDATLMGRDVYQGMFGTQYEADLAANPTVANARMAQIKDAIMKAITPEKTASDGAGVTPAPSGGTLQGPSVVVNKGGDVVNGGDTNIGIVGMRDLSHGGMRMGYR